jgi:O-antigen ligase
LQSTYVHSGQNLPIRRVATGSLFGNELCLKLLMAALFLPEGLSFFIGDFRLTAARALLIIFSITVGLRLFQSNKSNLVWIPSDTMAIVAGVWLMLATAVTGGSTGLKGSGIGVIEFTGAYYVFRHFLGPVDSSVRVIRFSCKLTILAVAVALLDPLSGKLFTYEFVKGITGYVIPVFEGAVAGQSETVFRNGLVRAMGPFEHSILFGAICVWFGSFALITFPSRLFAWSVAGIALIGVWFSGARGPLLAYGISCALALVYFATRDFSARWKVIGLLVASGIIFIFLFSGSPVTTILKFALIDPRTAWYRQAIWEVAGSQVIQSPIFGIGSAGQWNWHAHHILSSASVDAFWLRTAMAYGIPGSLLIFLTMVTAFQLGSIDRSRYLSLEERRLSVALGIVITASIFLGFTVDYWGASWILLGVFSGMRANLAEVAILRHRTARVMGSKGQLKHLSTFSKV